MSDPLDSRHDPIPVHRLIQVAAGDVEIPADSLDWTVGYDEPESTRIDDDSADDDVHHVGEAKPIATRFEDGATRDEILQKAPERPSLLHEVS